MQLLFGTAALLVVIVLLSRLRVSGSGSDPSMGEMSPQWLAEYRASRPWRP
jgi:hypothetical protein